MQLLLDIKQLRASLQQATVAMQQATGKMTSQAKTAGRAMQTAGKKAKGFGNAIDFIKTRIIGAGLFFAGFYQGLILFRQTIGEIIGEFFDLDDALRRVQSITKESDEEIEELRSSLLKLAKAGALFDQSAADVADSMFSIAQAGYTSAEALDLARLAAEGAAVGFTEAETSAQVLVSVLKAYDKPVSEARDIMDILFQAVDTGIITFEDLATNLGRVMASAAALNVPLEEVVGTVATLTLRGFTAAQAMTSVNRVLMTFIRPSNRARKAAAELGIELNRDFIATRGLVGVMNEMWIASGQSVDVFAEMFDRIQSTRGAVSLMGDDGVLLARVMTDMGGATEGAGAMAEALEHRAKSLKFQMAILRVQILATATEALTPLASGLGIVVRKINDILKGQNAFFSFFSNLRVLVVALVAAFLWMQRAAIAGMFASIGASLSGMKTIMQVSRAEVGLFGTALRGLGAIMSALGPAIIFVAIMALPKLFRMLDTSRDVMAQAKTHVDQFTASMAGLGELVAQGKLTPDERDLAVTRFAFKDIRNILGDVVGEVQKWRDEETELFGITSKTLAPAMSRLFNGITSGFSDWSKKSDAVKKDMMGLVQEIVDGAGLSATELDLLSRQFTALEVTAATALEKELFQDAASLVGEAASQAGTLEARLAEVEETALDVEDTFGDTSIAAEDVEAGIEGWVDGLSKARDLMEEILGLTDKQSVLLTAMIEPVEDRIALRNIRIADAKREQLQYAEDHGIVLDDLEEGENSVLDTLQNELDTLERQNELDAAIVDQLETRLSYEEELDETMLAQAAKQDLLNDKLTTLTGTLMPEQLRLLAQVVDTFLPRGREGIEDWVRLTEGMGETMDQEVLAAVLDIVRTLEDNDLEIDVTQAMINLGLVQDQTTILSTRLRGLGTMTEQQVQAATRFGMGILSGAGQHGIRDFMGGLALVGEAGPEVVRLPRGSDVISNAAAGHALRTAGAGQAPMSVHAEANITTSLLKDFQALKEAVLKAMDEKLDEAAARAGMARPRLGTLGAGQWRT